METMKVKEYRAFFIDVLGSIYDQAEAESFFYIILEDRYRLRRIDLALQPELVFTAEEIREWDLIREQLEREIPLQYILGRTSFYGLEFMVDENVLIPRQETEELVEWIISAAAKRISQEGVRILDIGTGSGCIAISLAKNIAGSEVYAIDVSEKALAIAEKNAALNNVKVHFMLADILATEDLERQFDIIVSNPPYVRNLEKGEIRKNVLDHEPHLALFVEDDDASVFYRKISQLASRNLDDNGQLYFEINQYLGAEMIELLRKEGFRDIELRKDIYGNDRMIFSSK